MNYIGYLPISALIKYNWYKIILDKLKMDLPKQPPPKIYSCQLNDRFCGGN